MNQTAAVLTFILFLSSCQIYKAVNMMHQTKVDYEQWTNQSGKTVVFIPMVHAGKAEFYDNVKQTITDYKSKDYIVFHEGSNSKIPDSALTAATIAKYIDFPEFPTLNRTDITRHIYLLKFRRMMGFLPDSTTYARMFTESFIFRNMVIQPGSKHLGITESDVNVDVGIYEIISAFEKKHGEIDLDHVDFGTVLKSSLASHRRIKGIDMDEYIIDMRDQHLANTIAQSSNKKILVIYGMAHMKGTLKFLQSLDPSWVINK